MATQVSHKVYIPVRANEDGEFYMEHELSAAADVARFNVSETDKRTGKSWSGENPFQRLDAGFIIWEQKQK